MPQALRILVDNAADRATISAADTAAGMGVDALKTDFKSEACRILSSTGTIELTWPTVEGVGVIVIPASNLTASSTIRARAYSDEAGTVLLEDTGVKFAAPGALLGNWDFSQPLNVNSFNNETYITALYFNEQQPCRKLVIDLDNDTEAFIDIARLVVGVYQQFAYNAGWGVAMGLTDMTQVTRNASGDIRADWGPKSNTLTFDLKWVVASERAFLQQLVRLGVGRSIFVSLLPENDDPVAERDYSCYGKQLQTSRVVRDNFAHHSTQIQLEGF